jgi:hypothetical protein
VNLASTIRRLFAVLVTAGLVFAPLVRPAMAAPVSGISMQATAADISSLADDIASLATAEMASDMPCCPSSAPEAVDCDRCVLMATCMSQGLMAIPVSVTHPYPTAAASLALRRNDSRPDGLGRPPPEHPPRTLV